MRRTGTTLILAMVFVYAGGFRLATLNRPFLDDAEGAGSQIGVLARNYLRFPWTLTHGMPVLSSGPPGAGPVVYYPDHPPMLPLIVALSYAVFGVGAWQTRLPIAVLTLAAVAVLYRLLAAFGTRRAAVVAAAVLAAMPMTLYFGGFPDVVGMPLILFVLLTTLAYLSFHRAPAPATFGWLLAAFVLAGLCDWPAYVIVPVLVVHFAATRPRSDWGWIAAFAAAACLLFAATYFYITLATGAPWSWMAPLFRRRSSLVGHTAFTPQQWIEAAVGFNRTYHTTPVLVAAALWGATFPLRWGRTRPGATVLRLLLAWAGIYMVIASKALYDHEWAWLPLTPCLAVACALLIDWLLDAADRGQCAAAAVWMTVGLGAIFATSTARATFIELYRAGPAAPYTPMDVGRAVQAAAPGAGDVALLFGNDMLAQFWFYGDRPLRTGIWTPEDFEARLDDDVIDVMFNFDTQPWKGRATGFVFPKASEPDYAPLRDYLVARYPLVRLAPPLAARG